MRSNSYFWILVATIALCCNGCGSETEKSPGGGQPQAEVPTAKVRVPEPWVSKPKEQWPQIVLTNHAEFDGHGELEGASSFLIETDHGLILAATARHLIGPTGGVEPRIPLKEFNAKLKSWTMFPRTMPRSSVEVASLGVEGLKEGSDWLILSLNSLEGLPSRPLKIRKEPIRVGETVHLIGCAYAEGDCKQNVYSGIVTERPFHSKFRHNISPPVNIRGFSGAPIVDKDGYLVGVMGIWFMPKKSGEKHLESGGEDAKSIYDLLHRSR